MSLLEPPQRFVALLRESLSLEDRDGGEGGADNNGNDLLSDGTEDILSYVAFLAAGLCDAEEFTSETWIETLKPYMEQLASTSSSVKVENHDEVLNKFREAAEKALMGEEDDQESYGDHDDEGYEEVCDLRFK